MEVSQKYQDVLGQNYGFSFVPEVGVLDKNGTPVFFLTDVKSCKLSYHNQYNLLSITSATLPKEFLSYIKNNKNEPHICELYYTPRDVSNGEYNEDFVHLFDCNFIEFEISISADGEPANPTIMFFKNNKEEKNE